MVDETNGTYWQKATPGNYVPDLLEQACPEIDSTKTFIGKQYKNQHHTSILEVNYYLGVYDVHFKLA